MKMKPIFILLFLALTLVQPACKKDDEGSEVSYIYDFQIPAGTGFFHEIKTDIDTRRDGWLSQIGISRDQVKSVQVRYVRYTIINSNDKFDWVDRAFLKIAKYDAAVASPPYFEIGFNLQVPANQGSYLDLAPDETELKDYFLADKFRLSGKFINRTNAVTSTTTQVRLSLGFTVFKK
jgi:hypothetical protein